MDGFVYIHTPEMYTLTGAYMRAHARTHTHAPRCEPVHARA